MTLRSKIEAAIQTAGDSRAAAIAVCRVLEDEVGLNTHGWFDDDDELRELLASSPPADLSTRSADHWDRIAMRLEVALIARLRAANQPIAIATLLRALADCRAADFATMLEMHVSAAEREAVRALVEKRIRLLYRSEK